MTDSTRTLKVGSALLAVVIAGLIAGFILVNRGNGTATKNGSPTATPEDPKTQVEQAYLGFWDAWTVANRTLDPAPLNNVMTGNALTAAVDLVETQKRKDQPVRIEVAHNYSVTLVDANTASVDDRFVDHSVRLDAKTGQPVEKDPNKTVHNTYTMKKVNGQWRVAEIIGFRPSPSP